MIEGGVLKNNLILLLLPLIVMDDQSISIIDSLINYLDLYIIISSIIISILIYFCKLNIEAIKRQLSYYISLLKYNLGYKYNGIFSISVYIGIRFCMIPFILKTGGTEFGLGLVRGYSTSTYKDIDNLNIIENTPKQLILPENIKNKDFIKQTKDFIIDQKKAQFNKENYGNIFCILKEKEDSFNIIKKITTEDPELMHVIGHGFGDGSYQNNTFYYSQSIKGLRNVLKVGEILDKNGFISKTNTIPAICNLKPNNKTNVIAPVARIVTNQNALTTNASLLFMENGKKIIPKTNNLDFFVQDERFLFSIFNDDGYLGKRLVQKNSGYFFALESFDKEELEYFAQSIDNCHGIKSKVFKIRENSNLFRIKILDKESQKKMESMFIKYLPDFPEATAKVLDIYVPNTKIVLDAKQQLAEQGIYIQEKSNFNAIANLCIIYELRKNNKDIDHFINDNQNKNIERAFDALLINLDKDLQDDFYDPGKISPKLLNEINNWNNKMNLPVLEKIVDKVNIYESKRIKK